MTDKLKQDQKRPSERPPEQIKLEITIGPRTTKYLREEVLPSMRLQNPQIRELPDEQILTLVVHDHIKRLVRSALPLD